MGTSPPPQVGSNIGQHWGLSIEVLGCQLSRPAHHKYCSLYREHHLGSGGVEPTWSFVVDFKVVACIAVKCDYVVSIAVLFI